MTKGRYCPERDFPESAYVPGQGAHPSTLPAPPWRDQEWDGEAATLSAQPAYLFGVDLYNNGFYWEAHESWEELWRSAVNHPVSRDFLQGLIQCAAAVLKLSLGQIAGFESLADKGLAKLARVVAAGHAFFGGIDLQAFQLGFCSYRDTISEASDHGGAPKIVLAAAHADGPQIG